MAIRHSETGDIEFLEINVIPANRLTSEHIEAWSKLQLADVTLNSPFFHPEFTRIMGKVRDDIEVAILQQAGETVGFFPFQRESQNIGKAVAWGLSDINGIIVDKNVDWNVEELVRSCGLVAWHFDHLLAEQKPFQPYHFTVEDSPYMDLSNGYDSYQNQRRQAGSFLIKQAERKARKIAKEVGPLHFEMHTANSQAFESLVKWKQEQLIRMRYVDMFRFKWVMQLIELIWQTQNEDFSGVLSALYSGDKLIAVHLGIRSYEVLSSWIPTFDETYGKYSPGLILHVELAKKASEMGIKRIDLGRGYNQMKASLMSGAMPVAIGCVELRRLNRVLWAGWYGARRLVHASPLKGAPLQVYRRLRNWMLFKQRVAFSKQKQ